MEILITSILAFTSTNIDDIFLLTLFYGNKNFKSNEIIAGQFLGIIFLIVVSLIGSLIGLLVDEKYIGLLGLAPIYFGVKALWKLSRNEDDEATQPEASETKSNVLTVATVTVANGGDNVGIYIPLFATLTWPNKTVMIAVFLTMTLLWCLLARYFTKHPVVAKAIEKYGHWFTPFVLILLGLYIMYENETFSFFAN